MQVTIQRAALFKVLQMISGIVERKQTMPVLANVLIKVSPGALSLTATDTGLELIATLVPTATEGDWMTTVSARKLLDICRALPEAAEVKLTLEGNNVVLRSGRSRFLLATLPATDFPALEKVSFDMAFSLPQAALRQLLDSVHFAMGQQDIRHYLNGTLVDIAQGTIKCVATDGHRLALSQLEGAAVDGLGSRVILPRKSVLELLRLLEAGNETSVTLHLGKDHMRVEAGEWTLTSGLVSAQYPDYQRLIPRKIEHFATADREILRLGLLRAAILCNEKFRGVTLQMAADSLRIMANNPEQEEVEDIIALEYQGNDLEIGFNVAYLLDVVSTLSTERVRWSFSDPDEGVLIEPVDASGGHSSFYVVMPVRY